MAVKLTGEQENNSVKIETGAFFSPYKILEITDNSNYPTRKEKFVFEKSGFEPELCFQIKCDTGVRERNIILFGKFKKDKVSGKVIGWDHFNNMVERFLTKIANGQDVYIEDDFSTPPQLLKAYVGQEMLVVRYCSGTYTTDDGEEKPSYNEWNKVFNTKATLAEITTEWNKGKTYVKDFQPEIAESFEKIKDKASSEFKVDDTTAPDEPMF